MLQEIFECLNWTVPKPAVLAEMDCCNLLAPWWQISVKPRQELRDSAMQANSLHSHLSKPSQSTGCWNLPELAIFPSLGSHSSTPHRDKGSCSWLISDAYRNPQRALCSPHTVADRARVWWEVLSLVHILMLILGLCGWHLSAPPTLSVSLGHLSNRSLPHPHMYLLVTFLSVLCQVGMLSLLPGADQWDHLLRSFLHWGKQSDKLKEVS